MKVYTTVWFEDYKQGVDLTPVEMSEETLHMILEKVNEKFSEDILYAVEDEKCYLNIPYEKAHDFLKCLSDLLHDINEKISLAV
jgi:hypothetical protein